MNKLLSIYYTLACTFSPILVIYSFTGSSITVLDMMILLFYAISIPSYMMRRRNKITGTCLVLFLFVFTHSLIYLVSFGNMANFMRAMHLANYIFFIAFYNHTYFDVILGQKFIRFGSVVATLFLMVQHVAKMVFDQIIPGILPVFTNVEANLDGVVAETEISRFASFFVEPAAYALYIICAFAIELFYQQKTNIIIAVLLLSGAILSTSNTAIACTAFLLVLYIYKNGFFSYRTMVILASITIIVFITQPYLEAIFIRIEAGRSFDGRFNGYDYVYSFMNAEKEIEWIGNFKNKFNGYDYPDILWGMGFVSPEEIGYYLAGYARLLAYLGYIGVFVYICVYLRIFFSTKKKALLLAFLFLNLGSNTFLSASFLYYMCFIVSPIAISNYAKNFNCHHCLQR